MLFFCCDGVVERLFLGPRCTHPYLCAVLPAYRHSPSISPKIAPCCSGDVTARVQFYVREVAPKEGVTSSGFGIRWLDSFRYCMKNNTMDE